MQLQKLGKTGLSVSRVCLGTGNFGSPLCKEEAFSILDAFDAEGGNFLDTANVYGRWLPERSNLSEQWVGEWLGARGAKARVHVATKGGHYALSRPEVSRVTPEDIRADLEESLGALGLDCVDFYWLHRDNEALPMEELLACMEALAREGKLRFYGASNFSLARMREAEACAREKGWTGFSAVSNRWSLACANPSQTQDPTLVSVEDAFFRWHRETGMPLLPYSSTAQGFFQKLARAGVRAPGGELSAPLPEGTLTEAARAAYLNPRNLRTYETLLRLSERFDASVQTLSVACLRLAGFQVIPVAGVSRPAQLDALMAACALELPEAVFEEFDLFRA